MCMGETDSVENVVDPFYVRAGCCLSCGLPQQVQPDLFDWNERGGCRMKRQPKTKEELDGMVRLLWDQDVGCLRYGGDDPTILQRLAELGIAEQCDKAAPTARRVFRNHVSFNDSLGVKQTAHGLEKIFRAHIV